MFEFDAGKLVIIGIVALIVIGPKELPRVLRQAGQAMAKLRRMAAEFQAQFADAMREAELSEIKEEAGKLAASARIETGFNPIAELRSELTRAIEGTGTMPAEPPAGGAGAAASLPLPDPTQHPILAAEGFGGRDESATPQPELAAAACPSEGSEPPRSDVGGEPADLGPPRSLIEPVSRT